MGEGILCQTAAGRAGHTRAHTHTRAHARRPHSPAPALPASPRHRCRPQRCRAAGCHCPRSMGLPPAAAGLAPVEAGPSPVPPPAASPGAWAHAGLQPLGRAGQAPAAASSRLPRGQGPVLTACRAGLRTPGCPPRVVGTRGRGSLGALLLPGQLALAQPARCHGRELSRD